MVGRVSYFASYVASWVLVLRERQNDRMRAGARTECFVESEIMSQFHFPLSTPRGQGYSRDLYKEENDVTPDAARIPVGLKV